MARISAYWLLAAFTVWSGHAAEVIGTPSVIAGWNRNAPTASADGRAATRTRLPFLTAVTVNSSGRVVLIGGGKVRQIAADGKVATLSADENMGSFGQAAADGAGNVYYTGLLQVRKVAPDGSNLPVAGGFGPALAQEGLPALDASLQLTGLAVSPAGEVYFSDFHTLRVWRIDASGLLHAVAGTTTPGTAGEGGPATSAQLTFAGGLAFDASGALYIADTDRILKVRPDGTLVRISGSTPVSVESMTADSAGNVYFSQTAKYQIQRLASDGSLSVVAGTGEPATRDAVNNGCGSAARPDAGEARTARIGAISSLVVDGAGNLLAVDQSGWLLRQISPAGEIRTVAGAPPGFSGDGGPAGNATLANPHGLEFDSAGNLYIADTGNNRVRKVTADGIIRTIIGDGGPTADMEYSCSGDSVSYLRLPEAVAVDASGNVYVADTGKHRVLRLTPGGSLALFAGVGQPGFANAAPGTPATAVPLESPRAVGVDRAGNVYIGDAASRILKVGADGKVAKVLPQLRARSVTRDPAGNLYATAALVSYLITPGDELIPIAGLGPGPTVSPYVPQPLDNPDVDFIRGAGLTRDLKGIFYHISAEGGVELISPACSVTALQSGDLPVLGFTRPAASPEGIVLASDSDASVVWQLPRLNPQPGDSPSPKLAKGAAVRNAASQLVATRDQILPTGGFSSGLYRFLISDKIAPGELVRIEGQCIGPLEGVAAAYDTNGRLPTSLGGTRVLIGGMPAPLISVQSGRITAVTPLTLEPNLSVELEVNFGGASARAPVETAAMMPGLFRTALPDGSSAVVALNQDGRLNSQENPAEPGSVVTLWGTGFGKTEPTGTDGVPATGPNQKFGVEVRVTISGVPADVLYAGPAPGFVGLTQINVLVPASGSGRVELAMGNAPFRQVVALFVR